MAKIKTYQPVVDYTSQISVSAHSGISKAAQSERQIAENWSVLGTDLTTMITDELKLRNVENATELASQISYDKKPVDVEINGQTETVNMTHVIQPEGKIVGESGMLAYKKILANNWISQLDNDLTQITETQANESEDIFETMEMFSAKTLEKHEAIYEQLPDTVSNLLRADAEKHIITRGARVQNNFLAEKNRTDNELWDNGHSNLTEKIWNTAESGGDATKHIDELNEHYKNGIELKNIKEATSTNHAQRMKDVAGIVSFFKLTNTLTTKDYKDPTIVSMDLKNTQAIINLLNPIPGVDSYNVYDMVNKLGTTLTKQQVHDTLQNPEMRTKMLAHFNRRSTYLKSLLTGQDDLIEGINLTNSSIATRDAGFQDRDYTKKELEQMNVLANKRYIDKYNQTTGKNLGVGNAATDPQYQIWLATYMQKMDPKMQSLIKNNFVNFDPAQMKGFYDNGFFSALKNYTHKGTAENALVVHFGDEVGHDMTVFTEMIESGIISIEDLGRMYTDISDRRARGTMLSHDEIAQELGYTDAAALKKGVFGIYQSMSPGASEMRMASRYNLILKKVQSNVMTETLLNTYDLKDWIYKQEATVDQQYALIKDGYIHNPSNRRARDSINRESYIARHRSAQKYMLPSFNRETKRWEINGEWNLDYAIPLINMMISKDPRIKIGHYDKFWTADKPGFFSTFRQGRLSVQEFVDEEFRNMGRVKLVPTGAAQEFPQFYVGKVNDNGSIDYIQNPDRSKAILDLAKYYVPAKRNLVTGNSEFRKMLVDKEFLKHDGTPVNQEQIDLDSWGYWASSEWLQFKHGLADIIPDPWQTTEETLGAGAVGIAAPGIYRGTGAVKDMAKGALNWALSKTGFKFKTKTNVTRKAKLAYGAIKNSKLPWWGRAAIAMSLFTMSSVNSRYITNALDGNNLWENDHGLPYLGYYREPGMYDIPEFLVDAYDSSIPEYVHTEEYTTPSGTSFNKGNKSTVMLGAEQDPDLGWIVFPHVVVINGERKLLNTEEAMQHAKDKGVNVGYVTFEDGMDARNMAEGFSDTVNYWRSNPHANWWLDGINPGIPND